MKKKKTWFLLIIIFILLFSVTLFYGLQNRPDIKINLQQFQTKLETNFGEKIYKSKEGKNSPINEIENVNWREVTMTAKYDDQFISSFENSLEPNLSQDVIVQATPKEHYAWEKKNDVHGTLEFTISITIDEREVLSKVEFKNEFKSEAETIEFSNNNPFDNFINEKNQKADRVTYSYETLVPANNTTRRSQVKIFIEINDIQKYVWNDGKSGSFSFEMEIIVDNREIITKEEVQQALVKLNRPEYENIEAAVKYYAEEISLLDDKASITTISSNDEQTKLKISVILSVDYKWDIEPNIKEKTFEVDVKINNLTISFEHLDNMIDEIINKELAKDEAINNIKALLESQNYLKQDSIIIEEQEDDIILIQFELKDSFKWSNNQEASVKLQKAL